MMKKAIEEAWNFLKANPFMRDREGKTIPPSAALYAIMGQKIMQEARNPPEGGNIGRRALEEMARNEVNQRMKTPSMAVNTFKKPLPPHFVPHHEGKPYYPQAQQGDERFLYGDEEEKARFSNVQSANEQEYNLLNDYDYYEPLMQRLEQR